MPPSILVKPSHAQRSIPYARLPARRQSGLVRGRIESTWLEGKLSLSSPRRRGNSANRRIPQKSRDEKRVCPVGHTHVCDTSSAHKFKSDPPIHSHHSAQDLDPARRPCGESVTLSICLPIYPWPAHDPEQQNHEFPAGRTREPASPPMPWIAAACFSRSEQAGQAMSSRDCCNPADSGVNENFGFPAGSGPDRGVAWRPAESAVPLPPRTADLFDHRV